MRAGLPIFSLVGLCVFCRLEYIHRLTSEGVCFSFPINFGR
jgi:hypothetical protein